MTTVSSDNLTTVTTDFQNNTVQLGFLRTSVGGDLQRTCGGSLNDSIDLCDYRVLVPFCMLWISLGIVLVCFFGFLYGSFMTKQELRPRTNAAIQAIVHSVALVVVALHIAAVILVAYKSTNYPFAVRHKRDNITNLFGDSALTPFFYIFVVSTMYPIFMLIYSVVMTRKHEEVHRKIEQLKQLKKIQQEERLKELKEKQQQGSPKAALMPIETTTFVKLNDKDDASRSSTKLPSPPPPPHTEETLDSPVAQTNDSVAETPTVVVSEAVDLPDEALQAMKHLSKIGSRASLIAHKSRSIDESSSQDVVVSMEPQESETVAETVAETVVEVVPKKVQFQEMVEVREVVRDEDVSSV